jgi:hypothetical protein
VDGEGWDVADVGVVYGRFMDGPSLEMGCERHLGLKLCFHCAS